MATTAQPPGGEHDRLDDQVMAAIDDLEVRFLLDPDTILDPPTATGGDAAA